MQKKLIKAWGPYGIGTVVADNKEEAEATPGTLRVSPDRFATLHEGGYFEADEPERPVPLEVRTAFKGTPHSIEQEPAPRKLAPQGARSEAAPVAEGGELRPVDPEKEP